MCYIGGSIGKKFNSLVTVHDYKHCSSNGKAT